MASGDNTRDEPFDGFDRLTTGRLTPGTVAAPVHDVATLREWGRDAGQTLWPRGREWWFVAAIGVLLTVAYLPVWHAGFVWDDDSHLTENACIVGPLGFAGIWTSPESYYFPLTTSTLWLVHAAFGLNPLPYHLLNVVLHAVNAFLLWRVLLRLRVPGAWLGALLWALHPVQVESVAWISELKNTQSALFYLLAIWFYVQWASQGPVGAASRYALAVLCGAAAILSKSSTVMLPVVLWLAETWLARNEPQSAVGSIRQAHRGRIRQAHRRHAQAAEVAALLSWWRLVSLAPFLGLSALAAVWTIWEQRFHSAAAGAAWSQSAVERLIIAGKDFWFYLGKLAWPHPLIFIYPRWTTGINQASSYLAIVGVVALMAGLWRWRKQAGGVLFASVYFGVSLFPVLGFFNVYFFRYSFVGDHFQYLASMGPLALAGAMAAELGRRSVAGRRSHVVAVAAAVVVVSLTSLSWRQATTYRDNETLFRSVIERNPGSAMAHNNLAMEYARDGRLADAIAHFRTALRLDPNSAEIHYNLANSVKKTAGGLPEAIEHYEAALRLQPDYAEAHNNLALALEHVPGRLNDALAHYEAALRYKPDNARAHNNLAVVLATLPGRAAEAIAHYEAALALQPHYAIAHKNLADVLSTLPGRDADAQAHYERALALQPDFPEAHYGLANLFVRQPGREADAQRQYEEALRLKPDYAEAHNNLGILFARQGRLAEAAQHWRRALEIAPDYADPRRNLELLERRGAGRR